MAKRIEMDILFWVLFFLAIVVIIVLLNWKYFNKIALGINLIPIS